MKIERTNLSRWILIGLALLPLYRAAARRPEPLPDFEVLSLDGRTVRSDRLRQSSKWMFIYVETRCHPCSTLLDTIDKNEPLQLVQKIVIVVGGASVEQAREVNAQFPHLARAEWYADPTRASFRQLKLKGAPVALGVRQEVVQWAWSGAALDPDRLRSVLTTWRKE
ncbi:MAG: hypothetical protein ACRD8O_13325 [Bryobacteraceae bacterium]